MLRCVDEKRPWPQSKVHEDHIEKVNDEWCSVVAAHRQLKRPGLLERGSLDGLLSRQYKDIEGHRNEFRKNLIANIEKGLSSQQTSHRVQALFDAFKKEAATESEHGQGNEVRNTLAIAARAMQELVGTDIENVARADFAEAFVKLVEAASDRDEDDSDCDWQLDEKEASDLWADLRTRLYEEYNRPEGGYARLMYGNTEPATRRFLQLAFNRMRAHPKVLVAQSLVGREGLNLHEACRTVVLLHPEWNPGVVEQQIGRVDRIGSLWEKQLDRSIFDKNSNGELPRIEIRAVVFQGTYDEKNWQVLQDRWDDLRAQLHGIVISPRIADKYADAKEMVSEINGAAPTFSPSATVT
jgi:hypothetical protein